MPRIALPDPNAPMVLADGAEIAPSATSSFARIEIPSNTDAQRIVSATRRKLVDLPALPKQINAYAAVLIYTASGLSDDEISVATGFTAQQIRKLRTQPAYTELETIVIDAVRANTAETVTTILAEKETHAARKLGDLIDSEDHKVALAATNSLLDRRGHTAKQQIDVRMQMENTFRIEYVDKRGVENAVIDLKVEDEDGNGS